MAPPSQWAWPTGEVRNDLNYSIHFLNLNFADASRDAGVSEGTLKAYQAMNQFLSSFIERVSTKKKIFF